MTYIIAWRYNDKVHTESHTNLAHAYFRMDRLSTVLGVTEVTLHLKN